MNKTININLGGNFFHIDEVAYYNLKRYLDAVRSSLSDDPKGRDEILNDVESRIGELLSEKIKDVRQVINENDINGVIEIMGKPEDYMVDDDLFYDDIPPAGRSKNKKMFRDGEDKFLGGVSSGMAHYFSIDVIWIRIAWLVAAFGFGFGFIAYIIMWILLPEANTTAEKLEMMGEPVNISNIERKIREEMSSVSNKINNGINDVSDKVKNADYQKYGNKARSGMQDFLHTLGKIVGTLLMIFGKFIGILLIIISVAVILGLLISSFTVGSLDFTNSDWLYQNTMIYNYSGLPIWVVSIILFLLVGIPFFFLFILGMKILSSRSNIIGRTAKLSLLGIWLVALLFTVYLGTRQIMQNAYEGSVIENRELPGFQADTLHLKMIDDISLTDNTLLRQRWGHNIVVDKNNQERIYSNYISLNILPSDSDKIYVKIRKKSKGKDRSIARENAASIEYGYKVQDSMIVLDGYFLTDMNNKYRDQKVYIDLYLPKDQVIYLDKSTNSFLYDVTNIQDIYDQNMARHYFRMTEDGLDCMDCSGDEIKVIEGKPTKPESVNLQINEKGLQIEVVDKKSKKANVKIDENGIKIYSETDSID